MTTLHIDDDVLRAAKSLAMAQGGTLGEVISELAREGLRQRQQAATEGDFPIFASDEDAPRITPEMVRWAADES